MITRWPLTTLKYSKAADSRLSPSSRHYIGKADFLFYPSDIKEGAFFFLMHIYF